MYHDLAPSWPHWRWASAAAATAALLQLPTLTNAQSPAALHPTAIEHRVRVGDTLQQLALRYLGDASQWPQLQSHNRIANPYRLQPGSVLEIPWQLMRPASASVAYVHGAAHVQRAASSPARVQTGMALHEGDQLVLDPQAFVTVRLADGTQVRVQAASAIQLNQLRRRGRAGSLQSVLELEQGGMDVEVPGHTDAQRRLDVVTPVAATSVRGTTFNIQHDTQGRTSTALYQGQVAMHSAAAPQAPALLQAGYGMSVSASGQASPTTSLLPPPDTRQLPTLHEDAQWLQLPLAQPNGVQAWQLVISQDPQGLQVLRNGRFTADSTARFAALDDGHYYLHARSIDTHGLLSPASRVTLRVKAHPVAPLTQVPAPGGLLAQGEAQLQCTPVEGAHHYRLQVVALPHAQSPVSPALFADPTLDTQHHQCQFDLSSLAVGSYAWRLASVRQGSGEAMDQGPYATAQLMHIGARPSAPSAHDIQPQTQAGVTTLHWPAEPGHRFRLQAFAPADSNSPTLDTMLEQPSWRASGLPPGIWHVRIQVQDPSGLHSAFSPPRSVTVLPLVHDGFDEPVSTGTGLGLEH